MYKVFQIHVHNVTQINQKKNKKNKTNLKLRSV